MMARVAWQHSSNDAHTYIPCNIGSNLTGTSGSLKSSLRRPSKLTVMAREAVITTVNRASIAL